MGEKRHEAIRACATERRDAPAAEPFARYRGAGIRSSRAQVATPKRPDKATSHG